jgi:hypothetical protein
LLILANVIISSPSLSTREAERVAAQCKVYEIGRTLDLLADHAADLVPGPPADWSSTSRTSHPSVEQRLTFARWWILSHRYAGKRVQVMFGTASRIGVGHRLLNDEATLREVSAWSVK